MYLGQWVCLPVGLSRATCYSQRKWKVEAVADGNVVEEEAVEAGYGSDGTWYHCRWLPRWQGQPSPEEPAVSFETVECKWLCWPNLDNTHRDDTPTRTHTTSQQWSTATEQTNKRQNRELHIRKKGWGRKIKKTKVEVTKLDKEIKGWLMLKRQREGQRQTKVAIVEMKYMDTWKGNWWLVREETVPGTFFLNFFIFSICNLSSLFIHRLRLSVVTNSGCMTHQKML